MKIIIVDCGKVDSSLTEQLYMGGHEITLVGRDADVLDAITNGIDMMDMVGNGAVYKIQMEAGIEDTDLLVATTNSDELNMLCCLITKKAGNCQTIARIRNPKYAEEIRYVREELNLSMAISPELAAAKEMSRPLWFPSAIKINIFTKGQVEILEFITPKHSVLYNVRVYGITPKLHYSVLICAVKRGEDVIIPNGNFQMMGGDKMYFVAPPMESMKFFKEVGIINNSIKTTMFVGGGRVTYYLAKVLQDTPIQIKTIGQDFKHCRTLNEELSNVVATHGNGSSRQVLLEEDIRQMEAFASLTGFDEENIILSLYATSQSKAEPITKIDRIAFENMVEPMNLGSIIYPELVTMDPILQYVRAMQNSLGSNVGTLYKTVANRAEALESRVEKNTPMIGAPLGKLFLKDSLLVACIDRNGKITTPRDRDTIEGHDMTIIVTTNTRLNDLRDTLR